MAAEDCLALLVREDWQNQAACRGKDVDVFFPELSDDKGKTKEQLKEELRVKKELAKRICFNCPVREECEEYSSRSNAGQPEEYGIWGGLDEEERFRKYGFPFNQSLRRH